MRVIESSSTTSTPHKQLQESVDFVSSHTPLTPTASSSSSSFRSSYLADMPDSSTSPTSSSSTTSSSSKGKEGSSSDPNESFSAAQARLAGWSAEHGDERVVEHDISLRAPAAVAKEIVPHIRRMLNTAIEENAKLKEENDELKEANRTLEASMSFHQQDASFTLPSPIRGDNHPFTPHVDTPPLSALHTPSRPLPEQSTPSKLNPALQSSPSHPSPSPSSSSSAPIVLPAHPQPTSCLSLLTFVFTFFILLASALIILLMAASLSSSPVGIRPT